MNEPKKPILLYVGGFAAVAVVAAGVFLLFHSRSSQARAEVTERAQTQQLGPLVQVALAKRSPPQRAVTIQAEARPYATVTMYAKVSGYLREIRVDKGDDVKEGQFIARIESPELDAQEVAAEADAKYKKLISKRAEALVQPGIVSAQDRDVAVSNAEVAAATEKSVATQKGYEVLRAPFDGTVTARYADVGALLQSASSSQTSALPVVTLSQIERLRIYGYVDQRDAPFLKIGDDADVKLQERPNQKISGRITRLSDELDSKTRMMLVEVDLDNKTREIVAGSYVDVTLHLAVPSFVTVPSSALVLRGKAPFVAVISDDDRVTYRPVELAADDGSEALVAKGIDEGQRVAINLGDSLVDGAKIQAMPLPGVDLAKAK